MNSPKPLKGDVVQLVTESPVFNGALAYIEEPTEWGAHVSIPTWVAGNQPLQHTPYRALLSEMRPVGHPSNQDYHVHLGAIIPVSETSVPITSVVITPVNGVAKPKRPVITRSQARDSGYTGDECPVCQGIRMSRNGSCLKCEDCGSTNGCS